jgi:2,3,4,5-tetrahydropyridine-2-carboxylate N-succinyltransferase
VLEPVQAAPVIIEDGCFIGSRAIVVEGVRVGKRSRAGCQRGAHGQHAHHRRHRPEPQEMKGFVPPRSVVIPGTVPKKFPAGEYGVPCALIIGQRKESTDKKTSLNDALREHSVAV